MMPSYSWKEKGTSTNSSRLTTFNIMTETHLDATGFFTTAEVGLISQISGCLSVNEFVPCYSALTSSQRIRQRWPRIAHVMTSAWQQFTTQQLAWVLSKNINPRKFSLSGSTFKSMCSSGNLWVVKALLERTSINVNEHISLKEDVPAVDPSSSDEDEDEESEATASA